MASRYQQLLLLATAIVISYAPSETEAQVCYISTSHSGTYAATQAYQQAYTQYYTTSCGWWGYGRCGRSRTAYRTAYRTVTGYQVNYQSTAQCCAGYSGSPPNCPPVCSSACVNGDCTAPNTCSCNTGWTGGTCADDINECVSNNGGCAQNCVNTAGSYHCTCNAGYSLTANGHGCNDVVECNTNNGGCNQVCTNTIGSFECSCNTGYELSANPLICVDTNECANNNGGCAQNCHNTVGSYHCTCNTGYTLSSNGHACLDNDECALNTHLCHHVCINTIGSYICDCNVGYMLNSDGLTCSDIDECATNNGGCDQNCHNTVGSYYCTCNIGFLLDEDSHGCSDHNECATGHDNCDQNCHNSHGSFSCSCNSTWRLDANGYTCNDIDECAEDSSGCTQICNNTPGSYFCTCFVGFSLDGDKHTCNDINECNTNNGGCEHFCTNTIGSYDCTCRVGYDLATDFHGCDGQPCVPQLTAPQNGSMWCTGLQVTDQNCSFACDAGFTFAGSELRECQNNNNWTGVDASCTPKHCPFLINPRNGYVVRNVDIDCGTVLTTACEIKCVEDYYINDTTPVYQTCVANQTSRGVYWTTQPECELILPCHSNPCQHGGVCTNIGTDGYRCDCSGTYYSGDNCETGVISISTIPIIYSNQSSVEIEITASPSESITITLVASDSLDISPSNITLTIPSTAVFEISSLEPGQYIITYTVTGPSADDYEDSQSFVVLVLEPDSVQQPNRYFTQLGLDVGELRPGCCETASLSYQCPSSAAASFPSTCSWSLQGTSHYASNGIVYVSGSDVELPLSIAGTKVSVSADNVDSSLLDSSLPCSACSSTVRSCYHFDFTPSDVFDLLQSRSLAQTYLRNIKTFLPSWLDFAINTTAHINDTSFSLLDYTTTLAVGSDVNNIVGCEGLDVENEGLYSIFRYDGHLIGQVESNKRGHELSEEDPICFAVNLCRGPDAPVHITIPTSTLNAVTSLNQIQPYTSTGWQFVFREATVSNVRVPSLYSFPNTIRYWNGNTWFTPSNQDFDLRLEATMNSQLTSRRLWINYMFDGDVFHQYNPQNQQMQGMLIGEQALTANMTIGNKIAAMNLRNTMSPTVFSLSGYSTTSIPGGASAKLIYSPSGSDNFFSRVLSLPRDETSCLVDAFVKFNDTTSDLSWMTFITDCVAFQITNYQFPSGSARHRVYLTGATDPPTPDNHWDGAVVKVYSDLEDSNLPLNQYLTVRQPATGPAISAGFWSGGQSSARLYEAEFSILGTQFIAPAVIDDDYLTFSSNTSIFGRYNTQISGRVPTGASWDNVSFVVSGDFETGPASFVERVDEYTHEYATTIITLANERITQAEIARNASQERLANFQMKVNEKSSTVSVEAANYQQALTAVATASAAVATLQAQVNQISLEAQSTLTDICQDDDCVSICVPEVECLACDHTMVSNTSGLCNVTSEETMADYRTVPSTVNRWSYQHHCRILTRITGWGMTSFTQTCSYVSMPEEEIVEEEEAYIKAVNVSRVQSCVEDTVDTSIQQVCCAEVNCNKKLPNITCILREASCQLAQQQAYSTLNETDQELLAPLQKLSEAKANLTIAVAEAAVAETKKNITQQELQILQQTLQRLMAAKDAQDSYYQQVVEAEQATLDLKTALANSTIEQLVNVRDLQFAVTFKESSPVIVPVVISVRIPKLNETINVSLSVDLTAPEKVLQRDIAEQILSRVGSMLSAKPHQDSMRVVESSPQQFERSCAAIGNLKSYLTQLNASLDNAVAHRQASWMNVSSTASSIRMFAIIPWLELSNVNFTVLDEQFGLTGIEDQVLEDSQNSSVVTTLGEKINMIADETQARTNELDTGIFVEWQAAMNAINTVNGEMCYGFVDCLTVSSRITQELLQDIPSELTGSLLDSFLAAKSSLLETGLEPSLTVAEVKMKMTPMWDILRRLDSTGYWCSAPPQIVVQPDEMVNVNYGEQLSITCRANSRLPISYKWRKNRFVQPGHTTNTYIKRPATYDDEGKYQCSATNAIGTTTSLFSTVAVFDPPVITLSPSDYTTFEGDDNGAVFVCNATARPSPNYQWHWSPNGEMWSPVVNSSSNQLVFRKPKMENEGWYRCRAYTANGWVHSRSARLTILSASISRLSYAVAFETILAETIEMSGSGEDSNDDELTSDKIGQAFLHSITNQFGDFTTVGLRNIRFSFQNTVTRSLPSTSLSLDLSVDFPYDLDRPLTDTALLAYSHFSDIKTALVLLESMLRNTTSRLEVGMHRFAVNNNSVAVGNLRYSCPPGHVLRYENFLCIGCAPGQYQDIVDNEWVCRDCGIGNYQTEDASTSCQLCPSRHTTISNVSRSIDDCLAHCQPNTFNSTHGVEPCLPCPDRYYQLTYGSTGCIPCPERSEIPQCILPSPSSRPTADAAANLAVILSVSISTALAVALAVTLVVIIVLIVVRRRRVNKMKSPPVGYFPENNLYGDTLINGSNVPKHYSVADDSEQHRSNPVYRELEMGEVDNPLYRATQDDELAASTPSHKLDTVDEEEQEDQEDPMYDSVDEASNLV